MKDPDNAVLAETLERLQVSTVELGLPPNPPPGEETPEPTP